MPAESKAQQHLFGMVHAYQNGELKNPSEKIREVAKHISPSDATDFAATKTKGLPGHVKKSEDLMNDNYLQGFVTRAQELGISKEAALTLLEKSSGALGNYFAQKALRSQVNLEDNPTASATIGGFGDSVLSAALRPHLPFIAPANTFQSLVGNPGSPEEKEDRLQRTLKRVENDDVVGRSARKLIPTGMISTGLGGAIGGGLAGAQAAEGADGNPLVGAGVGALSGGALGALLGIPLGAGIGGIRGWMDKQFLSDPAAREHAAEVMREHPVASTLPFGDMLTAADKYKKPSSKKSTKKASIVDDQNFINGFVKQAKEHGLSTGQAVDLWARIVDEQK